MAVQVREAKDIGMKELLSELIELGGSDLHIAVGIPPTARIDGR